MNLPPTKSRRLLRVSKGTCISDGAHRVSGAQAPTRMEGVGPLTRTEPASHIHVYPPERTDCTIPLDTHVNSMITPFSIRSTVGKERPVAEGSTLANNDHGPGASGTP